MDQQRIPTNNKSKKVIRILLIITGILGLILIAIAVYFYTIADTTKDSTNASTKTCGCYFIDPAVISECGDPRRAFQFNLKTTPSDQTCKAQCTTDQISTNLLNSTTDKDLYQVCQLNTIQDARCNEMTIKDSNGKIVTGKVSSSDELTIEAKFDAEYSQHQFIINNQSNDPDIVSTDKKIIKKTITDLSNKTTIEIVATAQDKNGDSINSPVCRRLIEIGQTGEKSVNDMTVETRKDSNNVVKISGIDISVGNITSDENLSIVFSFTQSVPSLTMSQGFTVDITKGEITILEKDLYNDNHFAGTTDFSTLDEIENEIVITADIRDSSKSIGKVSKTVTLNTPTTDTDSTDTSTSEEESSFSVTKTGTPTCVERVSPDNEALFTLTTTNTGNTSEGISSIKDKLPLGFEYKTDSTKINNVSVTDSDYVTVTNVGDSQEIVWEKDTPWTISANQALTITFSATAGSNTLTGTNKNEVIVTPVQVPEDPDTLRASFDITVAQDCDDPDATTDTTTDTTTPATGIFDSTVGRIIIGIFVITSGWYIYNKPFGRRVSEKFLNSGIYQNAEMTTWRIFKPKKYFEEKTVRRFQKK